MDGSIVYTLLPLMFTSHDESDGGGMSSRLKMRTTVYRGSTICIDHSSANEKIDAKMENMRRST